MTLVRPSGSDSVRTISVGVGIAVGGCLTWNITDVGAVADLLAAEYGVSIATVGLLSQIGGPLWASAIAALTMGLAAGLPFAVIAGLSVLALLALRTARV